MKKLQFTVVLAASCLLFNACNSKNKSATTDTTTVKSDTTTKIESTASKGNFDINSIPISNKDLGVFPFFTFPKGLKAQNNPLQRKFDKLYFAIDGKMVPIEGKVWKTYVVSDKNSGEEWSLPYFEKSYDDAILAAGGVKIFDGEISQAEFDRYNKAATYLGEEGSIGYTGEQIKTYIIRQADGNDIYIQLSGYSAAGKLNILQKEAFKQTISIIKADEIKKDLTEKGKAILHINFDTDKATLKAEGESAINEIAKVLQEDKTLKIAINGYTDNVGTEAKNLQLSKDRAATVLNNLLKSGIDKTRLKAEGYGAKDPIGDNSTDAGKAQNRRVELIKL